VIKCSIDIGTNSVRMLVADVHKGHISQIQRDGSITRLGEGLNYLGTIRRDAAERTIKKVEEFIHKARELNAARIRIVATSAAREAVNGRFVLERIKEITGESARILSGEEEAELIYKGVRTSLQPGEGKNAVIDIGGGSTELILVGEKGEIDLRSINMGAVRMTEIYFKHDPPTQQEIERGVGGCREAWEEAELADQMTGYQLIGVGGTITTLGAIKFQLDRYEREVVHNGVLTVGEIRSLLDRFMSLPQQQRAKIPGLEPGRADIIIAGTLILSMVMDILEVGSLRISDDGILVGLLV